MPPTSGQPPKRALIVGGSLAGLFAANLLHRLGWDVQVFERAGRALAGRGTGIVTHPELFDVLQIAGVAVDHTIGVAVPSRVVLDRQGGVVVAQPLRQILTAWGRLYRLLRDALPPDVYRAGRALERVQQDSARVTAQFADGTHTSGDVLIAADGIRSSVRAQFAPEVTPLYAGYVAWRGLIEEAAISPASHAALFERFGFCLPPHEQMLGYPVAGAQNSVAPGERRYNFVWYRPADEQQVLPALLTDSNGRRHHMAIPPHLLRTDVIADMRRAAEAVLAPQFAEMVRLTAQPFLQPIYDLESARLAFGRVAIIGDAAFVARPHVGIGVTKAAGDALALARALTQHDDTIAALRAFEAQRLPYGRAIVAHARRLGAYMQAQVKSDYEREMAERYRSAEAVMRETAVAPAAAL